MTYIKKDLKKKKKEIEQLYGAEADRHCVFQVIKASVGSRISH